MAVEGSERQVAAAEAIRAVGRREGEGQPRERFIGGEGGIVAESRWCRPCVQAVLGR